MKGNLNKPDPIPFEAFEKYHHDVLSEIESLEMEISTALRIEKKAKVQSMADKLKSSLSKKLAESVPSWSTLLKQSAKPLKKQGSDSFEEEDLSGDEEPE